MNIHVQIPVLPLSHLTSLSFSFFLWKFEINVTPDNGSRIGGISGSWVLLVNSPRPLGGSLGWS